MILPLFVILCCHQGHADLVKVEVTEALLSSTYSASYTASKCINNVTVAATGKVSAKHNMKVLVLFSPALSSPLAFLHLPWHSLIRHSGIVVDF